uniref:Uncharacterized protein n=1 Tax=Arundo donax TaxID=35708 RepID=A0A0A9TDU3_ARUDO
MATCLASIFSPANCSTSASATSSMPSPARYVLPRCLSRTASRGGDRRREACGGVVRVLEVAHHHGCHLRFRRLGGIALAGDNRLLWIQGRVEEKGSSRAKQSRRKLSIWGSSRGHIVCRAPPRGVAPLVAGHIPWRRCSPHGHLIRSPQSAGHLREIAGSKQEKWRGAKSESREGRILWRW